MALNKIDWFVPNLDIGIKHSVFFSGEGFNKSQTTSVLWLWSAAQSPCNFVFLSEIPMYLNLVTSNLEILSQPKGGKPFISVGSQKCMCGFVVFVLYQVMTPRIYKSSFSAKPPCICTPFPPLSRSHLVNQCITMLLAHCTNIAQFSDLIFCPETTQLCLGITFHTGTAVWIWHDCVSLCLDRVFSSIYFCHYLSFSEISCTESLSPPATLARKGSLLNTYI